LTFLGVGLVASGAVRSDMDIIVVVLVTTDIIDCAVYQAQRFLVGDGRVNQHRRYN
jgi:hypothetical protein